MSPQLIADLERASDGRFHETRKFLHNPLADGRSPRVLWCNRDMSLDELRQVLERHARPDLTTAIDGVRICKSNAGSPEHVMTGAVVTVIARGGKRLALGERVYDYQAGQYLIASVDLPVKVQVIEATPGESTLSFGMTLEPAVIAELLLQTGPGDLPRSPGTVRPGLAISDAPDELLDAVVRLLRLLDRPGDRKASGHKRNWYWSAAERGY
jgi:hypothetical protein